MPDVPADKKMVVPKDVADQLRTFAANHNIELQTIIVQLREIYYGACSSFKEEDGTRARQSALALKAILNTGRGGGIDLEGIILHMTYPSSVEAKKDHRIMNKCSLVGMFKWETGQKDNTGKPITTMILAPIVVWDETIQVAKKIPLNKVVKIRDIQVSETEEYGRQFTMGRASTFQILDNEEKDIIKLITSRYAKSLVQISEIEMKPSKNNDDKKLIKARVRECSIMSTKKGTIMARYSVYDDGVSDEDLRDNADENTTSILCDAGLGKFGPGSLCYFLGKISAATQQYPAGMFADLVIPIMKIEKSQDIMSSEIKNAEARKEYYASDEYKQKAAQEGTNPNQKAVPEKKKPDADDLDDVTGDVDLSSWDK